VDVVYRVLTRKEVRMIKKTLHIFVCLLGFLTAVPMVLAQGGPGGPPPQSPLPPVPVPAGNPITTAKANLGKALFWDEQLSSTRTTSCGTCHQPFKGGADPRGVFGSSRATHPGPDGVFGNADDVTGSVGLPLSNADGTYDLATFFDQREQVTGRYPPTSINAGYFNNALFWDGRATSPFRDPLTNAVILQNGGALESQAAGPPLGDSEMAHQGRDWNEAAARIAGATPLALAVSMPVDLQTWIDGRDYPTLFNEAFGTSVVTPARIVMAIATYERTQNSDQTALDLSLLPGGTPLSAAAQRGQGVFNDPGTACAGCHTGALFSDGQFHNIGVRPFNAAEDQGRFDVTGNNGDRQRFKTPSLRNVGLRGPYMHTGSLRTLEDVVDFYNRGGDFGAPNKGPRIQPLGLSPVQQADLVAFLRAALTDARVQNETAPFDRPALYGDSARVPVMSGPPAAGSGGLPPQIVAFEPALAGNPNCTIGLYDALGAAQATLIIDTNPVPASVTIPDAGSVLAAFEVTLNGTGAGNGYASVPYAVPIDPALVNNTLFARWFISDPGAAGGVAFSGMASLPVFPGPLPMAGPDVVMRSASGGVRIPISNLFTNDIAGTAGGALSIATLIQPVSGQASVQVVGGNILYTPANGFGTMDQFCYEVTDASGYTSNGHCPGRGHRGYRQQRRTTGAGGDDGWPGEIEVPGHSPFHLSCSGDRQPDRSRDLAGCRKRYRR
jgi:cytochrome c peroxidase